MIPGQGHRLVHKAVHLADQEELALALVLVMPALFASKDGCMTTQEIIDQMAALQARYGKPLLVTVDMLQNVVQLALYQNSVVGIDGRGDWCLDLRTELYATKPKMDRNTELSQETVREVIGALREITTERSRILAKLKAACESNDIPAILAGVRLLIGLDKSDGSATTISPV